MERRRTLLLGMVVCVAVAHALQAAEKLDRGLVAMERPDGSVFLSWRLLVDDPADIAFMVRRTDAAESFVTQVTCYVDTSVERGKTYTYQLLRKGKSEPLASATIKLTGSAKPYISIPLAGDYDFQKVGIADLDGDGAYEYLIKQPDFNTDP